jgi:hypothetical protein
MKMDLEVSHGEISNGVSVGVTATDGGAGHLENLSPLMRWSDSLALAVSGGEDGWSAWFL